ncbi:MAG: hypothetical protein OXG60_19875 [Chloroflexi bacterium]|nr:hypothetical protein [Chloroflexota bacterium]
MDRGTRAVVRCLHGMKHELCELREALQHIGTVEVVYVKEEPIEQDGDEKEAKDYRPAFDAFLKATIETPPPEEE